MLANSSTSIASRIESFVGRATSPYVLKCAAIVGSTAWAVAFIVFALRIDGPIDPTGHEVGGDFFHFYAAGRMILNGESASLYDMSAQQEVQRRIIGNPSFDRLAFFINPPSWALAIAPIAALPYRSAFVLYSLLMLAAFLMAMRILRPWLPRLQEHWTLVVALSLLFYPIIRTMTGGQNTALSLMLMCATYADLRHDRPHRAGLWLGLLFYKPQLAVLVCGLLMFRRQWKCIGIAGSIAVLHYVAGAMLCGFDWPLDMSRSLRVYWPLEFATSGWSHISLIEVCEYTLPQMMERWVGWVLVSAVAVMTIWSWRRAQCDSSEFALHWSLAVSAALLVSPHAQYYDAGLLVAPTLLLLDHSKGQHSNIGPWVAVALVLAYCLFPTYPLAKMLNFQPLILLPLGIWVWAIFESHPHFYFAYQKQALG